MIPTPGGTHLELTPNVSVPDTPFTKTLSYFKQYKGKENSPSNSRRNASLPEEIAELAREANEEDDEDLEKYREMDLGPMEPVVESVGLMCGVSEYEEEEDLKLSWINLSLEELVMENDTAGDLITFATPTKSNISPDRSSLGFKSFSYNTRAQEMQSQCPATPSSRRLSLLTEQNEDVDADVETSDALPRTQEKEVVVREEDPTFVTVIGMLPKAMFWVAAAPVAKLSNMAYDAMVEKLTHLELE